MLCENCGQRPATIHQSVTVNGQKQESHLCQVCAQEKGFGILGSPEFSFPNLSIHQLLSSFLGQQAFGTPHMAMPQAEPTCKNCGMTYSQFAEGGRLGCAQCYEHLEPHLTPLIKRIHGTTTHTGKAPKRTGGIVRKKRELMTLRQQLQAAIQNENYEEAARLRDSMKELEGQIQAGGEGNAVE
ncbi:MAG TPA: UvrB/UvrC motif-containing protein [Symbiobacteriaceae bacterium]|nr:UvrB/UvrC motif-containing protein [Symbiobacteriaceae bacterium]